MRSNLTQQLAKETYEYDWATGALYYKNPPRSRDPRKRAGSMTESGHRTIKLGGHTLASTWVIWLWHTGAFPKEEIDHINQQRWDDRIENLREATRAQNCMNRTRYNSNSYRGIKKHRSRYRAALKKGGESYCTELFLTKEEAARAYDALAREHFGEFAVLNFPDKPVRDWLYVASD